MTTRESGHAGKVWRGDESQRSDRESGHAGKVRRGDASQRSDRESGHAGKVRRGDESQWSGRETGHSGKVRRGDASRRSDRETEHAGKVRRGVGSPWSSRLVSGVLLCLSALQTTMAEHVYFNSYGHCISTTPFDLNDDVFVAMATGASELHETLICALTFVAPPGTGVCFTFRDFDIQDCGVSLSLYQASAVSGKPWKTLTCDSYEPTSMCTSERYVTMQLSKRRLNMNRNYHFQINVEKNDSNMSGEDVILASSIGLFVGIIAGVVVLIVLMAATVLCCCCTPCKARLHGDKGQAQSPPHQPAAVPSAPPAAELEEEQRPLQGAEPALYPPLPLHPYPAPYGEPDHPPPYAPPPYEEHGYPTKV